MSEEKFQIGDKFIVEIEGMWEENISQYSFAASEKKTVYKFKDIPGLYDAEHLKRFQRYEAT